MMEGGSDVPEPKGKSLTDLNDDCLIQICSYLDQIELLQLGLASEIFSVAIEHHIHCFVIPMDELIDNFSLKEMEHIFRRFGEYMRILISRPDSSLEGAFDEYFHLLYIYCHNIEEIEICYPWIPDFVTYKRIFEASAESIRKVTISQKVSAPMDEALSDLLRNASNLKILDLVDCDVTGKCFSNLANLTKLGLECCGSLVPEHFISLCKATKLKTLNISGCTLLNDEAFEVLCETQTQLEQLIMGNNYASGNFEIVGRLKSLRKIEISEFSRQLRKILMLLDELIQYHRSDLVSFDICSTFCYEKEAATNILSKIAQFHCLRELTLPNFNLMDNDNNLDDLVKNLVLLESLKITIFTHYQWLPNRALLQLITMKKLRKLQIGPIYPFGATLLPTIYEVLKTKKGAPQLSLILDENSADEDLLQALESTEYQNNEKYFKLVIDSELF